MVGFQPESFQPVGWLTSMLAWLTAPHTLRTGDRFIALLHAYGGSLATDGMHSVVHGWSQQGPQPYKLDDGTTIYTESRSYCPILWLSGQSAASSSYTLIVEQGTLLGHSSRCLAAGLTLGARARPWNAIRYIAFDFFKAFPNRAQGSSTIWRVHRDMVAAARNWNRSMTTHKEVTYHRLIWKQLMVDPVYRGASPVVGDIVEHTPRTLEFFPPWIPVEIWSIDSAKSHQHFIAQARAVFPRLRVGSVIHLMDCFKHQLNLFFMQFVASGDVEVAWASWGSAPWTFVVRRAPLDWGKVVGHRGSCRTSPATAQLMHETVDRLAKQFAVERVLVDDMHARLKRKCAGSG